MSIIAILVFGVLTSTVAHRLHTLEFKDLKEEFEGKVFKNFKENVSDKLLEQYGLEYTY